MSASDIIRSLYERPGGELSSKAREYSPDYPIFRRVARTGATRYTPAVRDDNFGRVYIYSPETITFPEYDEMRMDGQIRAGLSLIKLPVMQANWSISCDDQDIANFCTHVLKPHWHDFIRCALLALDFGYSIFEQIWRIEYDLAVSDSQGNKPGGKLKRYPRAVTLEDFSHIDPNTIYLLAYRQSGDFAGFKQYVATSAVVPENKCTIFSNEVEYKEWYGVSRTKPCYPYWVFKKYMYEWTNVYFETYSVPMKVGRYPEGRVENGFDANGNPVYTDNVDYMMDILEEMRNNHAIALPSGRYGEEGTGEYKWTVDPWESGRSGADHLAYIDHLNLMILKSLLVPQLALEVGGTGSYALAQTQVDFFFTGEQALMKQIEGAINKQILKRLVKYNFGHKAPEAKFNFQPLAGDLRSGLENILLETLGANKPIKMKDGSAITADWQWLADTLGVPLQTLSPEEYQQQQQEEMQQQQQMMQDSGYSGGQDSESEDQNYGGNQFGANPTGGDNSGQQDSANLSEEWTVVDNELVVKISE